jgi:hypothetical protein
MTFHNHRWWSHTSTELNPIRTDGKRRDRAEAASKRNTAPVFLIHGSIYRNPVQIKGFVGLGRNSCFDLLFHTDQESIWEVECDLACTLLRWHCGEMYSLVHYTTTDVSVSRLTRTMVFFDSLFSALTNTLKLKRVATWFPFTTLVRLNSLSGVVEWLTLRLRSRDVPISKLCPETGYSDWGFSWFPSCPSREMSVQCLT